MSASSKTKRRIARAADDSLRKTFVGLGPAPEPLPNGWNGWDADVTLAGPPAYPVLHWHKVGPKYSIDLDNQGSAFFVSMGTIGGVFMTAKHVVEAHSRKTPYSLLIFDAADNPSKFYATAIQNLALHPDFDAAVGLVKLHKPVREWRVGRRRRLAQCEPFIAFGFPRTQTGKFAHGSGFVASFHTAEVKGVVAEYQDHEPRFGPVYIHTQRLAGGISGGPLVSAVDGKVYALNSRGYPPDCEMALAIEPLLGWKLPFLGGRTLGSLLDEHEVHVDGSDTRAERDEAE